MYAVIETGGKQYRVSQGDQIRVEKLPAEEGAAYTFDKVIAIGGEGMKVGKDVAGATVSARVVAHGRHGKVIAYKYKPKKGFHKKIGHRQHYTLVEITGING